RLVFTARREVVGIRPGEFASKGMSMLSNARIGRSKARVVAVLFEVVAAAIVVLFVGCSSGEAPSSKPQGQMENSLCGNGLIDFGEPCDGMQLNGATCATVTGGAFPVGTLKCSPMCGFDMSGCTEAPGGGGPPQGGSPMLG